MNRLVYLLPLVILTGCVRLPKIDFGGKQVIAPRDAGSPATLAQNEGKSTLVIPAETKVVSTETYPVPATATTPYVPRQITTEWSFSKPTSFEMWSKDAQASTGTIDTTVAKHRIDVADRSKLLWIAIGCGVAGIIVRSLLPAWPALSNGLLIAAPCAFAAWKFSDVPSWLWAIILGIVGFMALGYKKAEWDKNNDGIPDVLQK
jgi:hypothetical protein